MCAVGSGNVDSVGRILDAGARVSYARGVEYGAGRTALAVARVRELGELVDLLVGRGARG